MAARPRRTVALCEGRAHDFPAESAGEALELTERSAQARSSRRRRPLGTPPRPVVSDVEEQGAEAQ